jgi:hypothetical protein
MIITDEKNKKVVQSHDFASVDCTIDAEDMRYVASLLRNNYSNPTLAVVREITANALDANSEAGSARPIEVSVPSTMNPHFCVRDFGGGLSQDDIFGLYSKYGKSTKRNSNNYIGAFGIGKFAPLSYGNNFTIVSYNGGVKCSYNVFVNEEDDTRIVKLHEEPSNDPSGLSIEVAISDGDVDNFKKVVQDFFRFFPKNEIPKFIGVGEDEKFLEDYKVIMESSHGNWFIIEDKRDYWHRNHHNAHAVMGRVHYPIDPTALNLSQFEEDGDDKSTYQLEQLIQQDNVYIRFDIGQLKLHHSRESLEYNKTTQRQIFETLQSVFSEIQEIAKEKLGDAEDLWDAKVKYAQVVNALPSTLRNIFDNAFEYDGEKINSPSFDRSYKYTEDLILTHYSKENDTDATDGYKCRSQKVNRLTATKKTCIMLQDIKSNHGNALRARTLFKEDDELEQVYVVYPVNERGESYLWDADGMAFNKISKNRLKYTSATEKAKLQSKGRAVQGESRASVPLFELDIENGKRHYRNADYWLNCTENIEQLEESDRELIYVPIANYKIVDEKATGQEESISLESFFRDVQGVRNLKKQIHGDDDTFEFPLVVGVRRKDCSKLEKSVWDTWSEYKKNFAKSYLLENLEKIVEAEKQMAFADHSYNLEEYRKLASLVENPNFKEICNNELDNDHIVNQVLAEFKLISKEDSSLTTIHRMVTFLKKEESEWVEKNIPSNFDINSFDADCKRIVDQYPLLRNISDEIYTWKNLSENNFGDNLIQYIKVMDDCNQKNV